ncbi:uncharacterized protein LOC125234703 [Leguminivora glycinivorella]|uniref:uncharacterized protein LOC125234703 n=1 Tax=Leguminivora glycinivorella TaxID=1035111 RepID=UPI00200BF824|nr:uncharacterized protein LOC125234703 [Leguminivora glycinivorella]
MKFLIVLSVLAAVASADYLKPSVLPAHAQELQEVIAAINSPSTDPATAAALEQLLLQTLGIDHLPESPISVGPAIVEETPIYAPIPVPVKPESPVPVKPYPVAVPETPALVPSPIIDATPADVAAASPLVQIILNIAN